MKDETNIPVKIRNMRIDDLADVYHLGEKLFSLREYPTLYRTWDEFEVVTFFSNDPDYCLVAEIEDSLAGFVLGTIIDKQNTSMMYGYLVWFGVDNEYQASGVGSLLFDYYKELMREAKVQKMLVDTSADNEKALSFFAGKGFHSPRDHVYLLLDL